MSLLLDSLERVKTKQRVLVAPPRPSTAPGIVFSAADAGAMVSDDTLVLQVRQLASNILATYPGADALGLAFLTLHWPSEAPRFLPEFARALAQCAGAEVLLVNDVRECGFEAPWQSWKQRYRYAIVQSDGRPSEMKLLAGADGVYLAIALGKTLRRRVKDSIALLRAARAPIRGSVLIGQSDKTNLYVTRPIAP